MSSRLNIEDTRVQTFSRHRRGSSGSLRRDFTRKPFLGTTTSNQGILSVSLGTGREECTQEKQRNKTLQQTEIDIQDNNVSLSLLQATFNNTPKNFKGGNRGVPRIWEGGAKNFFSDLGSHAHC